MRTVDDLAPEEFECPHCREMTHEGPTCEWCHASLDGPPTAPAIPGAPPPPPVQAGIQAPPPSPMAAAIGVAPSSTVDRARIQRIDPLSFIKNAGVLVVVSCLISYGLTFLLGLMFGGSNPMNAGMPPGMLPAMSAGMMFGLQVIAGVVG